MIKPRAFRRLYRLRKGDFWQAAVTFLAVLTFEEVLAGLLIGVLLSLLTLIVRTSDPQLSVLGRIPGTIAFRSTKYHPDAIQTPDYSSCVQMKASSSPMPPCCTNRFED